jgi:hypothetical protein
MVEQISPAVTDLALSNSVLPRTPEAGLLRLDAQGLYRAYHFLIEVCSPIEDQVLRGRIVGECFAQLLRDPRTRWIAGNFPVQNASSVMGNDEKAVQHTKGQRGHGEETHRSDGLTMIA